LGEGRETNAASEMSIVCGNGRPKRPGTETVIDHFPGKRAAGRQWNPIIHRFVEP